MFKRSKYDLQDIRDGKRALGYFLSVVVLGMIVIGVNVTMQVTWPKVMGEVTGAELEKIARKTGETQYTDMHRPSPRKQAVTTKERPEFVLKVAYSYSVDGAAYTGRDSAGTSRDEDILNSRIKDKYLEGTKVQVAYNPGNPTESTLHPAWSGNFALLWIIAFALGVLSFKLIRLKDPEEIPSEDF